MKRENFTSERVASFNCEPGKQQTLFWDGKAPGLGLRTTASGAKSFIFESRLHGKTLRITIGDVRTWTIGKAQAEATRLKSLTDQGIDPRQQEADKRAAREDAKIEAKRKELTFADVWSEYLIARHSKWSDGHYEDHVALSSAGGEKKKRGKGETAPGPLAALRPIRLSDLSAEKISRWLEKEATTRPTAAALSYRLLRAFIRWAEDTADYKGLIPADVYNARKVREALPKSQTKEGDSLQREQLAVWFESVRNISNPIASAYLQALLLTGARREEMAALRWEDVDFQWRSLTIRDKVDGIRVIPLPPYLASLLSALARRNEWVFSSLSAKGGRIAEPRYAHMAAIARAGLPHISIHGLRRSFGTLCEWVEMPSGIAAQIMGHKPSALAEKHYRRRPLDLLRMWHDKIEVWVLKQAAIEFVPAQSRLMVVNS
ncbi:tyrosine-type recombinase/integrase [Lacisediminimonas profundi]|uniref:tyrosine-type recombinase/integrase n=1 Tax=Lacisediminimonas profundi TaxID=2603856 RepID=UPI00124B5E7B|nr:integrase family protein [Lacisediminimonas profundi]